LTNPRRKDAMPQRWRVHHVDAVLRNRRYAGLAVFGGEVVGRGHWPVYISEAQHEQLKRRMLRHTKNTREKKPLRLETYLLAGLLRCGCGEPLYCTAGNKRKEGARARRYVCASHDKDRHAARCTARRLGADMLEAMFVASLRRLLGEGQGDEQSAISPDPARIFDLSLERDELRDAAVADDQAAFGATFERLLRRVASQASAWDEDGASRRRARQLEAVRRFETCAEAMLASTDQDRQTLGTTRLERENPGSFQGQGFSPAGLVDQTGRHANRGFSPALLMRSSGLEPPRAVKPTRPSTSFAHNRCARRCPDRPFCQGSRPHRTHRSGRVLPRCCHHSSETLS
jgi:hypothetical protein